MELIISPQADGSTVVNRHIDDVKKFVEYTDELVDDMRTVKSTVYVLMEKIGFLNTDGSFREKMDMKKIMDIGMKAAMGSKKFQQDFAFLADLLPLILKYKDL